STGRQLRATVEHADVIESQKSAFKNIVSQFVFTVHPPGKVHQQLLKLAFQKLTITLAPEGFLEEIDLPDRLAMHRRIDIAEVPLVGGNLSVGMEINLVG